MNITNKKIISLAIRLVSMIAVLCLFIDMVGVLFIGDDYVIRASFRWKILLFITTFSSVFLVGSEILKWPLKKLLYIGYPIYLLVLIICGLFATSPDLLGYKIALIVTPIVAQVFKQYGKGLLRKYLRLATRLSGGHLISKKGMAVIVGSMVFIALSVTGVHCMKGSLRFDLRQFIVRIFSKPEKPVYNPEFKDRHDPYHNYQQLFSDLNDVQLIAARANGTPRALTLEELEGGKYGLKHIKSNPLYRVDPLKHSAPYLVPKAQDFLDELGDAFQDSLYNRGYDRRHRFIVTSIYRTKNHIEQLRSSGNVNASKNSCHQYGTTVDISYVRFVKPAEHQASDNKLKHLLMQTVYDMQRAGRCYVKYERKQSCLHITIR